MTKRKKKIARCYIACNGMVMAFDEDDNQIPRCQGFIFDKARRIARRCDDLTAWGFTDARHWTEPADFSWWWREKRHRRRYRWATWIKWRLPRWIRNSGIFKDQGAS